MGRTTATWVGTDCERFEGTGGSMAGLIWPLFVIVESIYGGGGGGGIRVGRRGGGMARLVTGVSSEEINEKKCEIFVIMKDQ